MPNPCKNMIFSPPPMGVLESDIKRLQKILTLADCKGENTSVSTEDVYRYYNMTTDRDYFVMQLLFGHGMHTVLNAGPPVGFQGRGTRQPAMLLKYIGTDDPSRTVRVLEIGCGRGYCTLFLAGLTPANVHFHGVDLLAKHIEYAEEINAYRSRVHFHTGDACKWEPPDEMKFDLVFGCESLCHLDHTSFVKHISKFMNKGAKLVIIDGFRGRHWSQCDDLYRQAMTIVEMGFKCDEMVSKEAWTRECSEVGMQLLDDIDYSGEATPFWSAVYRIASLLLYFPQLICFYAKSSQERKETVSNFAACCMVAHALAGKSAEYGALVLHYPKKL